MTPAGLYCAAGDFHIDPCRGAPRAVITHAHSDHARRGSRAYLTSPTGAILLRERVARRAVIQAVPYGETVTIQGVRVSLHPAGHILGSAQVRVEHRGEVWVVSGDYKLEADPTCEPFEPVRCHTFLTECTFGRSRFQWRPAREIFAEINAWWRANQVRGLTSVLRAYPLGKAQRLLAGVDHAIGPVVVGAAARTFVEAYRRAGVSLPATSRRITPGCLVIGGEATGVVAFASGWMALPQAAKRFGVERGFVLSDHADWNGLLAAVKATGASRILATHGDGREFVRWLQRRGWRARVWRGRYEPQMEWDFDE
jgi:putative mRNA 3-end processing factor